MSYLDRLRALDAKKHLPEQPSKPSKGPSEPFEGGLSKRFSPNFTASSAPITVPAFQRERLQRESDRRNADAARMGLIDRWCACGQLASYAWPDGRRRDVWRCLDCGPVRGEA